MDEVFLVVRRKKTTMFLEATEVTSVIELKKMIEGITKIAPAQQVLYDKEDIVLDDAKTLADYGLTRLNGKIHSPAEVLLAFKVDDATGFEKPEATPYTKCPELPDVMKPKEKNPDYCEAKFP